MNSSAEATTPHGGDVASSVGSESDSGVHVSIDLGKCAGHARCFAVSEELFDLDDSGYALHAEIDVPAGQEHLAREAVAACPERAIHIR